jgi:hypothetical protein
MSDLRRITEDYRLDKLVVASDAASVFRATDLRSGATVAIKLLTGEAGADPGDSGERFAGAARALQALRHPSLPRVVDFGLTTAGSAFLVTEHLQGTVLGEHTGTSPGRVLALLLQVLDGLAALETVGIAHGNLHIDNLLVVPGGEDGGGDQVKLLGIGGAALGLAPAPASPDEGRRRDLRDLALLACRLLGAGTAPVELPPAVAAAMDQPEILRSLLAAMLDERTDPPLAYAEARSRLDLALRGQPAAAAAQADLPAERPALPQDVRPSVPPAEARQTMDLPQPVDRRSRLGLLVGGGLLAALLAVTVFLFSSRPRVPAEKAPLPETPAEETPAPSPSPIPPQPATTSTPAPAEVHPQIVRAETLLAAGDPGAAREALNAIPAAERDALTGEAHERYQRLAAALAESEHTSLAADLDRALGSGDLARLRSVVASVRPQERKGLPASVRRNLDRAARALDADARLSRAEQAGERGTILAEAAALLAVVPRAAHAREARETAAAALEADAEKAVAEGRPDAALQSLQTLRQGWPGRAGLGERIARVEAQLRDDQRLEALLADAAREAKANRPQEGLRLLAGAVPNPRFEERFRQTKASLEAQIAGLDRTPPVLAIPSRWEAAYEKGVSIKVPLVVTDEHAVASVEVWARPEGGRFEKVPVRHLTASQYEAEIPPSLHQNKTVELYATASDTSGNQGRLGSAESPRTVKRKKWYDKLEKLLPGKPDG